MLLPKSRQVTDSSLFLLSGEIDFKNLTLIINSFVVLKKLEYMIERELLKNNYEADLMLIQYSNGLKSFRKNLFYPKL